MNIIKTLIKDATSVTGNLLKATGVLSTTLSTVAVDATSLLASGIAATPGVTKELFKSPLTATAAYIAEDEGREYSEVEAELLAKLPENAPQAVKDAVIYSSRLAAQMMKDDEEEVRKAQS